MKERIEPLLDYPLMAYSTARSLVFSTEFYLLSLLQLPLPGAKKHLPELDVATFVEIRKASMELFKRDAENIRKGVYPLSVLKPESPVRHALRLPKIILDGASLYLRRNRGRTAEFDKEARELLSDLPRYYRRNFHFQTSGYLSEKSAELYEHQVEVLFAGAADAMRRLIIQPLRDRFGTNDGKGLTFLEIAAGTGRATRFVKLAFPKAKIVVNDLSDPYLKVAERRLAEFPRLDFVQADAANLPFQDKTFDAVYSVFLFHELPLEARKAVLAETHRVLRPGGFVGLVDSVQTDDNPAFNKLLSKFPQNYHEPFYRNYIAHPMQGLLADEGFTGIGSDLGFFSKVCWAVASGDTK